VVHGPGTLVYVRTVDEDTPSATQFGGVNGWVMEFGIYGTEVLAVVPEPNVLILLMSGLATVYYSRRRARGRRG
jgi:hypothetical protein